MKNSAPTLRDFKKGNAFLPQTLKNFKKHEIQNSHKIVVLAELLIDSIDTMMEGDIPLKDIPEHPINQALRFCLALSNRSAEFKQVRETNYISTLMMKVDTVIRKNFQPIENLENYKDYGNHDK